MTEIAHIEFENIVKTYPGEDGAIVHALADVSLAIGANEFFTLLGPSGCGKTTLLRTLAGFEAPDGGRILLDGREITAWPANKRPVNTVFQSYALFPHMTIQENVGFGLRMLGKPKSEWAARAEEMLHLVKLEQMASRRPDQLSGGQQQRVALARALAPSPEVLLLDEPLSALDLKLRKEMQIEMKRIQRESRTTFIFVTHDQEEALTMSDRIAVMCDGKVRQLGTPVDIYDHPSNRFVADFIGETNFIETRGAPVRTGDEITYETALGNLSVVAKDNGGGGSKPVLAIRPEKVRMNPDGQATGKNVISCRVSQMIFSGPDVDVRLTFEGIELRMRLPADMNGGARLAEGDEVALNLPPEHMRVVAA